MLLALEACSTEQNLPFSEAVRAGGMLYLSGQLGARLELECMALR